MTAVSAVSPVKQVSLSGTGRACLERESHPLKTNTASVALIKSQRFTVNDATQAGYQMIRELLLCS